MLNGTATKADVEWLVESLETVTAERDDLVSELERVRKVHRAEQRRSADRLRACLDAK